MGQLYIMEVSKVSQSKRKKKKKRFPTDVALMSDLNKEISMCGYPDVDRALKSYRPETSESL